MPPALFFFLKIALAIQGLLWFHRNFGIVYSISVKNAIGILTRIALHLQYGLYGHFLKLIFIGVQLLYNVVLVSTVQQSESGVCIHISPLFWISFPFRSPQSIEQSSLCYIQQFFICYLLYTQYQQCIYVNPNLPIHPTPSLSPLGVHTFVLYVCVSIFVLRIICTIFLATQNLSLPSLV